MRMVSLAPGRYHASLLLFFDSLQQFAYMAAESLQVDRCGKLGQDLGNSRPLSHASLVRSRMHFSIESLHDRAVLLVAIRRDQGRLQLVPQSLAVVHDFIDAAVSPLQLFSLFSAQSSTHFVNNKLWTLTNGLTLLSQREMTWRGPGAPGCVCRPHTQSLWPHLMLVQGTQKRSLLQGRPLKNETIGQSYSILLPLTYLSLGITTWSTGANSDTRSSISRLVAS